MSTSIKLGDRTPMNYFVGNRQVISMYLGRILVWGRTAPVENLELSPSGTVHFDAAGQSKYITVTSHDTWYVTKDSNWISLNKNSGTSGQTCLISCAENTDFSPRYGTVTFTCGTRSETITVYQAQFVPEFVVEPTSFNLNSTASTTITFSFTIDSRCEWTISSSNWITVDPNNERGSGSRQNVQATVATNTGGQRTGYIYISEDDGQADTVQISVTQKGVAVQPTVEAHAINWYNDSTDTWLNKQSWQVIFKGGSTTKTINSIVVSVIDDSGNTIQVLPTSNSITLAANETVYWGLNASDFNNPNNAQLSLNGHDVDYDEYSLTVYGDIVSDEAPFVQENV